MIFGIIASVAPSVKRIVRSSIGPCPNCASRSVDHVEVADRLSLFFVPVWSFNSQEAVYCKKCRFMSAPGEYENWLVRRTLDETAQLGNNVADGMRTPRPRPRLVVDVVRRFRMTGNFVQNAVPMHN